MRDLSEIIEANAPLPGACDHGRVDRCTICDEEGVVKPFAPEIVTYEVWEQRGGFRPQRRHNDVGWANAATARQIAAHHTEENRLVDRYEAASRRFFVIRATTAFEEVRD